MSLKHLSRTLSKLSVFEEPKLHLEQYPTVPDVAAELLWSASTRGLIKDKKVVDLGAGTGILGLGALLLGAEEVVFVEKDSDALELLKKNIAFLEEDYVLPRYSLVLGDVSGVSGSFDLVIMNPPFGTKVKRVDSLFLEKAFSLSDNVISIHKLSTKQYVSNFFREHGFVLVDVFDFVFPLKKSLDHHVLKVKNVEVSGFIGRRS